MKVQAAHPSQPNWQHEDPHEARIVAMMAGALKGMSASIFIYFNANLPLGEHFADAHVVLSPNSTFQL